MLDPALGVYRAFVAVTSPEFVGDVWCERSEQNGKAVRGVHNGRVLRAPELRERVHQLVESRQGGVVVETTRGCFIGSRFQRGMHGANDVALFLTVYLR